MKRKSMSVALSLLVTASMVVGCGSNASDSSSDSTTAENSNIKRYKATDASQCPDVAKERKDTIIVGGFDPSGVFLPTMTTTAYDADISRMMFDELMVPKEDGEMEYRLAESIEQDKDDDTTYIIKIKDTKWSDGEPVKADDLALYYYLVADKSYEGQADIVTASYDNVVGAKEYQEGTADTISGIKVIDDKTLSVKFTSYSPYSQTDIGMIQPLPSHYLKGKWSQGNLDGLKSVYYDPNIPVCGQYKMVDFKKGQETKLVANEDYHMGAPKIKNVVLKYTTPTTALQMLKSGETDIDGVQTDSDNIDGVEGAGFLDYSLYPGNSYGYIALNQALPQFKDVEVRKALTIGLDRKKIVDTIFDGYAEVPKIPESVVSWAYAEPDKTYDYDLEKAKKMLDDAGWKENADGIREKDGQKLTMKLQIPQGTNGTDTILSVAEDCYKKLGVDYSGEAIDFNSLVGKVDSKDFNAFMLYWSLDVIPGGDTLFYSKGSQNYNSYNDPKIDELTDKIQSEHGGKDALKDLYKEYYNELNETLPYICLVQGKSCTVSNSRIKNVDTSSFVKLSRIMYKLEISDSDK